MALSLPTQTEDVPMRPTSSLADPASGVPTGSLPIAKILLWILFLVSVHAFTEGWA
jgi:hypothetical protein